MSDAMIPKGIGGPERKATPAGSGSAPLAGSPEAGAADTQEAAREGDQGAGSALGENLREQVEGRIRQEAEAFPIEEESKGNGKISSRFIQDCLYAMELGDGLLYAAVHRNRFLWNNSAREWLVWTGHTWAPDIMQQTLIAVEDVVDVLLDETEQITKQISWAVKKGDEKGQEHLEEKREAYFKRIRKYRTVDGRNAVLTMARTCREPLAIRGDELDRDPWLLGCANGVIDLRTGEHRPGRPEDLISKASPVEWKGLHEPAPRFEAWLLEILSGDAPKTCDRKCAECKEKCSGPELVDFLWRALGYAITGLSIEHILIVLWGKKRNGKGTLVGLISRVLGPLAAPIRAEMLLDQGRSRSSAGPSPDIMGLRGLRIAFASETDKDRRFSTAQVKWLTGGDELVARSPYDKRDTNFPATHTLILFSNHKPKASDTEEAFWERVRLIPFLLSYVDREPSDPNERSQIKGLSDELFRDESSGILAWLVRGCLVYQARGLSMPPAVAKATADWQEAENEILDFVQDYCRRDPMLKSRATVLYENFNRWYRANKNPEGISQTMFGRIMGRRFEKKKVEGVVYYVGIDVVKEVPEPDKTQDGNEKKLF